jgi:hypothetical protein
MVSSPLIMGCACAGQMASHALPATKAASATRDNFTCFMINSLKEEAKCPSQG